MEPEAVPPEYQRELTRRSKQTAAQRDADVMHEAQQRIGAELDRMLTLEPGKRFASHLRAMQRQLAQLERLLGRNARS